MRITADTTLERLLQIRPEAVSLLDTMGTPCWDRLEIPIDAYCHLAGTNTVGLLKRIALLPVPGTETHFGVEPLYRLVDFLTEDHRQFLEKDLMEINHLLDVHNIPTYPDGYVLKLAYQLFKAFEEKFREHLREEEEHVFPWILRLDATVRNPDLPPQLHRGSVRNYSAGHTHGGEKELQRMIAEIEEKIRNHSLQEPTAHITEQLRMKISEFAQRLSHHAGLENSILFPRAVEIETRLADQEIHPLPSNPNP